MRRTANHLIVGLIAFFLCITAQAQETATPPHSGTNSYSDTIVNNFIKACTDTGAPDNYCTCMIDNISTLLTEAEYIAEEVAYIKTGAISDKLSQVISESVSKCCVRR